MRKGSIPVTRLAIGWLCALLLAGCTVHFVTDYDDQIDAGLTQFNTDLITFVEKMNAASNTPAGTYEKNVDFYTSERARLDTLIVRASAHKTLNSCPATDAIVKALKQSLQQVSNAAGAGPIPLPDPNAIAIKDDDCSVTLLQLVKQGLQQMEHFHKVQGALGIPVEAHDPILVGGLGVLVRAAITVEIAKKTGKSIGG